MLAAIPTVEVTEDGDVASIGRPNGEVYPLNAITGEKMSAEFFVDAVVVPFAKQVNVEVGQFGGPKGVGIVDDALVIALFETQLVVDGEGIGVVLFVNGAIEFAFKEVGMMNGLHGVGFPLFGEFYPSGFDVREIGPDDPNGFTIPFDGVSPKDGEGVLVAVVDNVVNLFGGNGFRHEFSGDQ
jgi:hypothetical protein